MQENSGQGSLGQRQFPFILPTTSWWRKSLLWGGAAIFVTFFYVAAAVAIYRMGREPDRLVGAPPALMLVFAEEPTAPDSSDVSEQVQAETQVDEPEVEEEPVEESEPEPKVEEEPEPVIEDVKPDAIITPPSDMVEEVKQEEPKEEPKAETVKPQPKPEKPDPKKVEKPERKKTPPPKKQVQKAERTQKAAAPIVAAKRGETFAAPRTSVTDGFNGKLQNDWKQKVQARLRTIASQTSVSTGSRKTIALVKFAYDASGKVTSATIIASSGDARIDNLALKVVQRSSPLPKPPNGAGSFTVPVQIR